jgi:hypothetical protein
MKTDLLIFTKLHGNDKIAEVFEQALKYVHQDVEDIQVSYDGERLSITCEGDIFVQNKVYATANMLVNKFSEKREDKINLERIINNSMDIMDRAHPNWREIIKNNPPPKFTK